MAQLYSGPIHYREGGEWKPIVNTLVPSPREDYARENEANDYRLLLPQNLHDGPVRVERGAHWVAFSLVGARAEGAFSGQTATYPEALPGVTVSYTAQNDRVKEAITLAGPAAPSTFAFQVETSPGLTARPTEGGEVEFVDADEQVRLSFADPYMYDASGTEEAFSEAVEVSFAEGPSGLTLTLTADPVWLADPARVWPVTIDPTLPPLNPAKDCYVVSSPYANNKHCDRVVVKMGQEGGTIRRTLLDFDLSSVPVPANIHDADLAMYLDDATTGQWADWVVRWVQSPWTNDVTWNTKPAMGSIDFALRTMNGSSLGWKHWHPTELVQRWVNGRYGNFGMYLRQSTENVNNILSFISTDHADSTQWPHLDVIYDEWLGEMRFNKFESQRLTDRMHLHVNVANGNLVLHEQDLRIAGTGLDLRVDRFYNGLSTASSDLGPGWTLGTGRDVRLEFPPGGDVTFQGPSGYRIPFDEDAGTYTAPPGVDATLKLVSGVYEVEFHSKEKFKFNSSGQLTTHVDKNGNDITFAYNPDGTLAQITDTQNRTVTFAYSGGHLVSMTDNAGGRTYRYTYDGNGRLWTFEDPENGPGPPWVR